MKLYELVLIETSKRLKRSLIRFVLILMFLPVLLSIIGLAIRIFTSVSFNTWDLLPIIYPLYFLISILISVGTVKEEADDNSYVYVNILPFSKNIYLIARFISSFILIYGSFLISLLLFYFFSFLFNEGMFSELYYLWKYLIGFTFAILAYSSVFTFFGVSFRKATIYSILYFFIWEQVFSYGFFFIEKLTISFYLRNLLPSTQTTGIRSIFLMQQDIISTFHGITALIIITLVFLGLSIFIFNKKGFITGE